jgi:predicted nucleic acid-binding protein
MTHESDLSIRIRSRYPEFYKCWKQLVKEVGSGLVNELKKIFSKELGFVKEITSFKLKLIIDNNFILGQILGIIRKNENVDACFLYKILQSSIVEVYAPPKLREELFEKISEVLDQKDHEKAFEHAEILLSKIDVKDAQWIDSWKRANNLIGSVDSDDVPYLALAIEVGGHGIMSFDHVFHKQGDVKVWKHEDTDRVITNYNSGFISICILGKVSAVLGKLVAVIFKIIRDFIIRALRMLFRVMKSIFGQLGKIPVAIWIILVSLGIVFWEEVKQAGKSFFDMIREKTRELVMLIKNLLRQFQILIKSVWNLVEPGFTTAFEFIAFLYVEYSHLIEEIQTIKMSKAA